MKIIKHILLLLILFVSISLQAQEDFGPDIDPETDSIVHTPLPYFCGFENPEDTSGTAGWKFVKRAKVQHEFVVGQAVHRMGSHAMYVSPDGGATAGYSLFSSGSVVVAYKTFYLEKGTYDLMFEYRMQGEEHENSDVMRVAFYSGSIPTATAMDAFPQYALDNPFIDKNGVQVFTTSLWKQVEGKVTVATEGYYYLAFLFKADGDKNIYNPGPCIDNIQFDREKDATACATKPSNIQIKEDGAGIKLTWTASAESYEIMYNKISSIIDTTYTLITGVTSTEYSIPYSEIAEGVYNFRIRALCSNDTSMWIEKANYIVYDNTKHCLNYMDFTANGTVCEYGNFDNPHMEQRVIDYGYENRRSIHTVHYMEDEYDRLTGYELKTVPEGNFASVRLGNWTEGEHGDSPIGGSPSGRITYTYTIPHDKTVLLLHYAAVLQYASHHPAEAQTRIQVEILNGRNQRLECASADFNARDVAEGNTRGWRTYQPKEGEVLDHSCPVKWLDWSVLGLNLEPYKGQTVKIRLTLNACEADWHFAYGYFVLDCTEGEVGGMSCTERADTLFVPEGFDYLWYVQGDDKKTPISTERFFVPEENDINSYAVDLIYPEEDGCYFTLYANVWPRIPKVSVKTVHKPVDCVNYVELVNSSRMIDLKMDKSGNVVDTLDVPTSVAAIKEYYIEIKSNKGTVFENGITTTTNPSMRIIAPNEGDTFSIVVRGLYNTCEDVQELEVFAPRIGDTYGETVAYICQGAEVLFNGKTYTEAGVYVDTLKSEWCGCDSILSLKLETLITDTIEIDTIICSAEAPYVWMDESYEKSGVYTKNILSSLGCDSLYYILNLDILESLDIDLDAIPTICADDELFEIGYTINSGKLTGYSVRYEGLAKEEGFQDMDVDFAEDSTSLITIDLPVDVRPNRYEANLTFYNDECGDLDTTLTFDVLYSSDVIAQRWNDVLGVKSVEYNGNYKFTAFQWYLNGMPLEGFTHSQLYKIGETLDFHGEYSVLLTREEDGIAIMTCGFIPKQFSEDELSNVGLVVFEKDIVNIETPEKAKGGIYNMSGLLYSLFDLNEGVNFVEAPNQAGVYILRLNYENGNVELIKIVVR